MEIRGLMPPGSLRAYALSWALRIEIALQALMTVLDVITLRLWSAVLHLALVAIGLILLKGQLELLDWVNKETQEK